MITIELIIALISYYFVMYITPGPNNTMLTASGIKFGFSKTVPHIFGVSTGHAFQLTLVCLGLGKLFEQYPFIQDSLKWIGSAYLLYLAWKMFGSIKVEHQDTNKPLKFYEAILFQFVNPKAWVICSNAVVLFFPKEENLFFAIIFLVSFSYLINFPCISSWALFGSGIRNFLQNIRIKKTVEWVMAILLVLTGFSILFG